MIVFLSSLTIFVGCESFKLKILSTTEISVVVVLIPQNALQSLTTNPAAIEDEPLFTVPATIGTCNN